MKRRPVKIQQVRDSWMVFYQDRRFGQRYAAAGFYAPDHTLEQVQAWVRKQPKLILED